MFLEEISDPRTIVEASDDYGRKMYFDYRKTEKGRELLSSPSPIVLYLGTWRMTDKQGNKKKFICGINLAYLADEEELSAIQKALPDILKVRNMKSRYRIGKTLLPEIFRKAYRTYNVNNVATRPIRGRLYAIKASDEDKEQAKELASKDGQDWDELENQDRNQYIDQSVRKRGSEDVKRQEKSKKEREQIEQHVEPEAELEKPEVVPEIDLEEKPRKPPKPKKPPGPRPPKPPKPPAPPKAEFQPIELGPGYEEPAPREKPEVHGGPHSHLQSPIKSVQSGMAAPRHIKIKKPQTGKPSIVDREPDETGLP